MHQHAERGALVQLGCNGQRPVQRNAGAEQRGKFLGKEQNVALAAPGERGQLDVQRFFLFLADIDGREPLAAQLEGDQALGLGMNRARANLPVGGHGSEVKAVHREARHG